jgi:hypothetical protein
MGPIIPYNPSWLSTDFRVFNEVTGKIAGQDEVVRGIAKSSGFDSVRFWCMQSPIANSIGVLPEFRTSQQFTAARITTRESHRHHIL